MIPSLLITFGGLLPIFLLLLIYSIQEKRKSVTSRTFLILCYLNLILIILEIIDPYLFNINLDKIATFTLKIQWLLGSLFYYFLYTYIFLSLTEENRNIKTHKELFSKHKFYAALSVFTIVYCLIFPILNFATDVTKNESFFPMPHAGLSVVYGFILVIIATIQIIKYKKILPEAKRVLYLSVILVIGYIIIQIIFPNIALAQVLGFLILYLIYIIVENPDKYIIGEITKTKETIDKSNNNNRVVSNTLKKDSLFKINQINDLLAKHSTAINRETFKEDIDLVYTTLRNLDLSIENRLVILTNKEESAHSNIDLNPLLKDIYKLTYVQKKDKVEYKMIIEKGTPLKISVSYGSLLFTILNSIRNALINTEVGKITTIIGTKTMDNINYLTIECKDSGNGLSETEYANLKNEIINDNFSNEKSIDVLCISKRLEAVKGRLSIESFQDVGTKIISYLPYDKVNDEIFEETIFDHIEEKKTSIVEFNDKKLLLVDSNFNMINKLLDLYHIDVDKAINAENAINNIKQEINYEWIFVNIADESSLRIVGVLRDLVEKFDYKMPYLVALMPSSDDKYTKLVSENKFDNFIIEPIEIEALNRVLEKDNK